MDSNRVYQAGMQPILRFQEHPREAAGVFQHSPDTDDLEAAFSRIGEELPQGASADFRMIIQGRSRPLRSVIRDETYRIGREALLNAFRHSGAGRVEIEVEYAPTRLRIAVRDNGKGISPGLFRSGQGVHRGLCGMQAGAERMGAKLKLLSRVAAGTEVELSIPGHIAFVSQTSLPQLGWAHV